MFAPTMQYDWMDISTVFVRMAGRICSSMFHTCEYLILLSLSMFPTLLLGLLYLSFYARTRRQAPPADEAPLITCAAGERFKPSARDAGYLAVRMQSTPGAIDTPARLMEVRVRVVGTVDDHMCMCMCIGMVVLFFVFATCCRQSEIRFLCLLFFLCN